MVSTAGRVAVLGMAGRERAHLPEALDLVDRHLLVAEKIKQRVDQHRAMTGREHETVAIGPCRIGGIEFEEAREQHRGNIGRAHRQTGMTGLRQFDRIHRQRADRVRHAIVLGARSRTRGCSGKAGRLGEGGARRENGVRHRHGAGQARHEFARPRSCQTGGDQIAREARESNRAEPRCNGVMHRA